MDPSTSKTPTSMPSAAGRNHHPQGKRAMFRAVPLLEHPRSLDKAAEAENSVFTTSVTINMESGEDEAGVLPDGVSNYTAASLLPKPSNSLLQESPPLSWFCPDREGKKRVVVMGSGDFGLALAGRLVQANYCVLIASRNPQKARQRVFEVGATIMTQEEALQQSNVVVNAVPFSHVDSLPVLHLAGKILIDVSNRGPEASRILGNKSQAEHLQALVPSARVVKAFNVLSAYALTRGNMGSKEVPVCGNDEMARRLVCGMTRDLRLTPLDSGRLANAREVEEIPLRFFPEWTGAFITSLVLWVFFFVILVLEWQLCDNISNNTKDWSSFGYIASRNVSIACADTALFLLSVCYLPGVIAAYLQLSRGTKYSEFPLWLDRWLKSRKQLGLLMLLNASLHVLIKVAGSPLSWSTDWRNNTYNACGAFAMLLAGILGITSLPSVSGNMTWREFAFVQSKLGWFTLLFATLHLVFAVWVDLFTPNFVCYLPTNSQFVMVIPLLTLAFKVPLLLPCVDSRLSSIRNGYEKQPCCCFSRDHTTN